MMRFDVFLSYTSADRAAIVQPLLKKLEDQRIRSWCDVYEINWGDSIIERIQKGLSQSPIVIAFISRTYLERDWTMKELRTAMARQLSGRIIVLPVLLGVSCEELHDQLPFLAEIRHLSIYGYKEAETVADYHLTELIAELTRVQAHLKPIKVGPSFEVLQLEEPVLSLSFNQHYGFYAAMTQRQYAQVSRLGTARESGDLERSDIQSAIHAFIQKNKLSEDSVFESCWLDVDESYHAIYVLKSGNVIRPHCRSVLGGEIRDDDYITTGVPPSASCVIEGPRGEILFGYPDGAVFLWNKQAYQLGTHSGRVTCADRSEESIYVSGDERGHLAIWSTQSRTLKTMIRVLPAALSCVSVSRMAGAALIAAGDVDGNIAICTFNGDKQREFPRRDGAATKLSFIAGVPFLACARGACVEIWDYVKAKIVAVCEDHVAPITAMHIASGSHWEHGFSHDIDVPDSSIRIALVSAGFADGHVRGWQVEA